MFAPIYDQKQDPHSYLKTVLENSPPVEELVKSDEFKESLRRHSRKKLNMDKIATGLESIGRVEQPSIEIFNPDTEAIILRTLRPVYKIKDDTYSIPESSIWRRLDSNSQIRANIENAIPSIGRIELPTDPRILYVGTAFLVSQDLIMTNRHVAEYFCSGLGVDGLRFKKGQQAGIDFKEEFESPPEAQVFYDIVDVVMIHPFWDLAILRVKVPEKRLNPLVLSTEVRESNFKKEVVVIGYPAFDQRNNRAEQDRIFESVYDIKRLQPGVITGMSKVSSYAYTVEALSHDSSTLGGNSGSAIIDVNTGQVLGLHFAGIYQRSNFAISMYDLAKDDYIKKLNLNYQGSLPKDDYTWRNVWTLYDRQLEEVDSVAPITTAGKPRKRGTENEGVLKCPVEITDRGTLSITIPIEIKQDFGDQKEFWGKRSEEKGDNFFEGFIGTYEERLGYDQGFLGVPVPIPWLSDEQYEKVARNKMASSQRHILTYMHFSIVMNKERRLPFFTAVNIDGANKGDIPEDQGASTSWYYDDRIDRDAQMDNRYYRDSNGQTNPLDRGHLVRRIEPTWSETNSSVTVVKAHNDTFHWTNCSPQHSNFNKQTFLWATIENFLLYRAQAEGEKISVFSGPIFKENDPLYMAPAGVQLHVPVEFWKIVCYLKDGSLRVRGFLLSQKKQINSMLETLNYDDYNTYQVTLAALEEETGLSFRNSNENIDLKDFDANVIAEAIDQDKPLSESDLYNVF
ncbi:MAG: DNA/RNA non-specific endonuclease [Saprospiraceae bacterium]|nr:DNA/RNA non-specific endonuclease [Saprospiraceae bacterium]